MSLWEALGLGFVQGATEFLPVSSSGHLVMTQVVLGIEIPGVLFEVAVHVATLLSILVVYRQRVLALVTGVLSRELDALRYMGFIGVATVPAGLLGLLAKDRVEALFEYPAAPGLALLVTGALLWSTRSTQSRGTAGHPGWLGALLIGTAQAFALVPGISRSGATVVMALWLGMEAREAAAFSFLMAIPAIAGAAVLQVPDLASGAGPDNMALLGGGVSAAITGVLAIRTFVVMLARRSFHFFAPYCWIVGAGFLVYLRLS